MLLERQADGMKLKIYENRQEMGEAAGRMAAQVMKELLSQKETINVVFAAAPSQNEILDFLAESNVDFTRVRAFHMDEYLGLPQDASQRFSAYLEEHIFGQVPFKEIHYMCRGNGGEADADAECLRYSRLLCSFVPDVTLMGIGENGHIAFNDPHEARFDDERLVKPVTLDEKCRLQQVNDGCFADIARVPKEALTLTIPALMSAKAVICTVPGHTKRQAVTRTVTGPVTEACPASVMRTGNNCVLFCDKDSGFDLLKKQEGDENT